jgi:hypothetical protein
MGISMRNYMSMLRPLRTQPKVIIGCLKLSLNFADILNRLVCINSVSSRNTVSLCCMCMQICVCFVEYMTQQRSVAFIGISEAVVLRNI